MIRFILLSLLCGLAAGSILSPRTLATLDSVGDAALWVLVLAVGINLGANREALRGLPWQLGSLVRLAAAVVMGSIAATVAVGLPLGVPWRVGAAVGAGLGWYSLSSVLAAKLAGAETGALVLLANMSREMLALLLIPWLAQRWGKWSALAPGGATNMDTTLGLVNRYTDPETTALSFLLGVVLSALVPILVPLFLGGS